MKDLYSRVADKTGVPRHIVKAICFGYTYTRDNAFNEEDLENKLIEVVRLAQSLGRASMAKEVGVIIY